MHAHVCFGVKVWSISLPVKAVWTHMLDASKIKKVTADKGIQILTTALIILSHAY